MFLCRTVSTKHVMACFPPPPRHVFVFCSHDSQVIKAWDEAMLDMKVRSGSSIARVVPVFEIDQLPSSVWLGSWRESVRETSQTLNILVPNSLFTIGCLPHYECRIFVFG